MLPRVLVAGLNSDETDFGIPDIIPKNVNGCWRIYGSIEYGGLEHRMGMKLFGKLNTVVRLETHVNTWYQKFMSVKNSIKESTGSAVAMSFDGETVVT
ncbi:hypothetical protein HDU67_010384, partial [Dinochytrium kinnereticum]